MEDIAIRKNFAKNITNLRKLHNMSQAEFAKRINYSDKAVSKWENLETMPDVFTIQKLADFFNVTVDDLISKNDFVEEHKKAKNHIRITTLSMGLAFLIGIICYLVLAIIDLPHAILSIFGGFIASGIVFIVFSAIWFNKLYRFIAISMVIWPTIFVGMILLDYQYSWIFLVVGGITDILFAIFLSIEKGKDKS